MQWIPTISRGGKDSLFLAERRCGPGSKVGVCAIERVLVQKFATSKHFCNVLQKLFIEDMFVRSE